MAFQVKYSALERLVHRLAFCSPAVQMTAADIEKAVFHDAYREVRAARPVFVTSLPRAGTTLTLEALSLFPSLASHTYRDMPFVLAPFAWSRLSAGFQRDAQMSERAHGDGMPVGYDSPEAFEEVLWRGFWPEKFGPERIGLWGKGDAKEEARRFFLEHMKKIIALRRPERPEDGRYISKNNANLARLELLCEMFPDGKVLVPLRHPLDHAASLLRQHLNFREMHLSEPFSRRYMADIGHYEFGALHRPIAFPALAAWTDGRDPDSLDYWLGYWIAAFEYVVERREKVTVFSYEELCANPRAGLAWICARLDLPEDGALEQAAALFRAPKAGRHEPDDADPALLHRAEDLQAALLGI